MGRCSHSKRQAVKEIWCVRGLPDKCWVGLLLGRYSPLAPTYPRPSRTPELKASFDLETLAWTLWNPSRFTVFTRDPIDTTAAQRSPPGTPSVLERCRLCRWRAGEAGGSIGTVGQRVGQEGGLRAPAGAARVLRSLGTRVTLGLGGRTICSPGHHLLSILHSKTVTSG